MQDGSALEVDVDVESRVDCVLDVRLDDDDESLRINVVRLSCVELGSGSNAVELT